MLPFYNHTYLTPSITLSNHFSPPLFEMLSFQKWSHTVCKFLGLAFFTHQIHPSFCMYPSLFLLFIPWHTMDHMDHSLFNHSPVKGHFVLSLCTHYQLMKQLILLGVLFYTHNYLASLTFTHGTIIIFISQMRKIEAHSK